MKNTALQNGQWFRKVSMDAFGNGQDLETWEFIKKDNTVLRRYDVLVTTGKDADIFSFKTPSAMKFIAAVDEKRKGLETFFNGRKTNVTHCPICVASSAKSMFRLSIYGGHYHQCKVCSHCYVINRASDEACEEYYARSTTYHKTYTDKKTSQKRLEQIYRPKAQWVINTYRSIYGRKPRSILDIGAGAGHFVYVCKSMGLEAEGVEISEASRDFCKKEFGFELDGRDITQHWQDYRDVDVVTFWGVIEHVTSPVKLLDAAYRILEGRKGLVVSEVPHWNCMSTVLQKASPHIVVRHLGPMGHINCFTDTSAITAYELSNFIPAAAWYYGMDFYELITHLMYKLKNDKLVKEMSGALNECQNVFDRGRLCDTLILAATPQGRIR